MDLQLIKTALNLEPVLPGLKPLKIGDDDRFEIAIRSKQLCQTPVESIKEVLRLVMLKVGVRGNNLPTEEEKPVLIAHIISEYGNHTPEEILLAFDMAICGKLGIDARCYENFSCLYFSQIMNAYRIWAAETFRQKIKIPVPERVYTQEEIDVINKEYEEFVKTKIGKKFIQQGTI